MHHDVGTVFNRANQIRSTEGVVDHQRNLVLVSDFGDSVDIRNVGMRVAESFDKDELRVFLDGGFDALEVVSVDEGRFDTEVTERMLQQVESTTVNRALDNHVVTTAGKSRDGVSNSSGTRGDSESGNATFEGSNTFFENTLSGVVDTAVNITTGLQGKAVCSILGVMENVFGDILRLIFLTCKALRTKGLRLVRSQNASRHSTVTYHRRSFECLGITNHFVIPTNLVGKKIE